MSKNLAFQYENEVILEKEEEIDEIREEQDEYEFRAEYGDFDEEDMTLERAKMYLQYGTYTPENINPFRWKAMVKLINRGIV